MKELKEAIAEILSKSTTGLNYSDQPFRLLPNDQKYPLVKFQMARNNPIQYIQQNGRSWATQLNFRIGVWFPFPDGCETIEQAEEMSFENITGATMQLNAILDILTSPMYKFNYNYPANGQVIIRVIPNPVTELRLIGIVATLGLQEPKPSDCCTSLYFKEADLYSRLGKRKKRIA